MEPATLHPFLMSPWPRDRCLLRVRPPRCGSRLRRIADNAPNENLEPDASEEPGPLSRTRGQAACVPASEARSRRAGEPTWSEAALDQRGLSMTLPSIRLYLTLYQGVVNG